MKTIELSLKEFLVAILHRWWIIILCALVGGGMFAVTGGNAVPMSEQTYQDTLATYQEEMQGRVARLKELENYVASAEYMAAPYRELLNHAYMYVWDSPLMHINPFDVEKAYAVIRVLPRENADKESIDDIIVRSIFLIEAASLQSALGASYPGDYPEKALRELIMAEKLGDDMFSIQCYNVNDDRVKPEGIIEGLYAYLAEQQKRAETVLGLYDFAILDKGTARFTDYKLDDYRKVRSENAVKYEEMSMLYESRVKAAKADYAAFKADEPILPIQTFAQKASSYGNVITGSIIGAVLGTLGVIFLYVIMLPVQTDDQIQRQLGVQYLGSVHSGGKASAEPALRVTVANLKESLKGVQRVLLTGSVTSNVITEIADKLNAIYKAEGIHFEGSGYILESADTVRLLAETEAIILVEQKQKSQMRKVNKEINRFRQSNREVTGYILC